jgi:hypothetical protein
MKWRAGGWGGGRGACVRLVAEANEATALKPEFDGVLLRFASLRLSALFAMARGAEPDHSRSAETHRRDERLVHGPVRVRLHSSDPRGGGCHYALRGEVLVDEAVVRSKRDATPRRQQLAHFRDVRGQRQWEHTLRMRGATSGGQGGRGGGMCPSSEGVCS